VTWSIISRIEMMSLVTHTVAGAAMQAAPAGMGFQGQNRGMTTDDLASAMKYFDDAVRHRDRDLAERVLDEDFALVLVHPASAQMPRTRWLEVLTDYVVHSYTVEEQLVDRSDDVAAVLTKVRMRATVLGEDRSGLFVISDVWRQGKDGWKVWRRHSSPLTAGGIPGT